LSIIQRVTGSTNPAGVSGGRGSPSYGASGLNADAFTLDDEELIPCASLSTAAQTSTPSCSGSTGYAARVENYLRIRRDTSTTNAWEVTAKDGTLYRYQTLESGGPNATFRWYLNKVTDRSGNHVDYEYYCPSPAEKECVISAIKYRNYDSSTVRATITFDRETTDRPDVLTYATGNAVLLQNVRRLTTIEVALNVSQLIRAYSLTYEQSAATGLSRLKSVQLYGRDATVTNGVVSDGTPVPATSFTYSDLSYPTVYTNATWTGLSSTPASMKPPADFNGDGRSDLCGATETASIRISSGASFTATNGHCEADDKIADFTGDGSADDILRVSYDESGSGFGPPKLTIYELDAQGYDFVAVTDPLPDPRQSGTSPSKLAFDGGIRLLGDFDGDGKVDFLSGNRRVWLSNGSSFAEKTSWTGVPSLAPGTVSVGDFNGDGKADLITIVTEDDKWRGRVYLSTGAAFVLTGAPVDISDVFDGPLTRFLFGDVNGDGRTDLVRVSTPGGTEYGTYKIKTFFSNGQDFSDTDFQETTDPGPRWAPGSQAADVNGDGRIDLLLPTSTASTSYRVYLSVGTGFQVSSNLSAGNVIHAGDYNGDGRTDFLLHSGADNIMLSSAGFPDLLTNITEPLGGTIAISYKPSSASSSHIPFNMQVVDSVTVSDGRGSPRIWEAGTTYSYSQGAWNASERRFMGFRTVSAQLPAIEGETTGPKTTTTYQQSVACLGRASLVESFDKNNGPRLRWVTDNYSTDTAAPLICTNTSTLVADTADQVTKTTKVERVFNSYGNVTYVKRHGDISFTGDESSDIFYFYPNTSDFVVACPGQVRTVSGLTAAGTILALTKHTYAGASLWSDPPASCQETKREDLISGANYATTLTEYDLWGNVTKVTEPDTNSGAAVLNACTAYTYDVSKRYITQIDLPPSCVNGTAGFSIQLKWDTDGDGTNDFLCGAPTRTTDVNNQNTDRSYDQLCRLTRETRPGGDYTVTNYIDMPLADGSSPGGVKASPMTQAIETRRPAPHPSTDTDDWATPSTINATTDQVWSKSWIDGLGTRVQEPGRRDVGRRLNRSRSRLQQAESREDAKPALLQCAPKARNTSGGRFHPGSCRLIW
jgi:hypothetical protein